MRFESWSGLSDSVEIPFLKHRRWIFGPYKKWWTGFLLSNSMLGILFERGKLLHRLLTGSCTDSSEGRLKVGFQMFLVWSTWSLVSWAQIFTIESIFGARECFARPSSNAFWPRTLVFECSLHATFNKKWTPLAGRWWKMPIVYSNLIGFVELVIVYGFYHENHHSSTIWGNMF